VSIPSISVIVFNYNGRHFLKTCFDSILKQSYKPYEIILMDDCSTDDSVEFTGKNYPSIKIVQHKKNRGIAAATNTGFNSAKGSYIIAIHNDAVADKNWLKELVNSMEKTGGKTVCIEGTVDHPQGIGIINGSLNILGYNTLDVFKDLEKKFYSGTCSMIIKNKILKEYCDPDYFFYGEDEYLGWKLRLLGYNIERSPKSVVMHKGSPTLKSDPSKFFYLNERNRLLNLFTFYETKNLLRILPLLVTINCFWDIVYLVRCDCRLLHNWKSRIWFILNFGKVLQKRSKMQRQRKVSDNEITKWMSSRVIPKKYPLSNTLNRLVQTYCNFTGMTVAENTIT